VKAADKTKVGTEHVVNKSAVPGSKAKDSARETNMKANDRAKETDQKINDAPH